MTIQQEASTLISELPDDSVRILIELIRKLNPAKSDMPKKGKRTLGIARGKYDIPDDIDACNDEIAEMFGVK